MILSHAESDGGGFLIADAALAAVVPSTEEDHCEGVIHDDDDAGAGLREDRSRAFAVQIWDAEWPAPTAGGGA